jgi:cysteine desulfurase
MNPQCIYLDNNATTAPLPEVSLAVQTAMQTLWGNPSSIHRVGQEARHQVDLAREAVAALVHATPAEITFTSGGTESANLAILTARKANPDRNVIVTSKIEHAAVGEMLDVYEDDGLEIIRLDNDGNGVMDMVQLQKLLEERADEISLVSLMWCNNETGVIEPIDKACKLCHQHGVLFHSDGTQWVAKMPVDIREGSGVPVDMLTFAAHKFHGPKGVGALYTREGLTIAPLVIGGPQERGKRGGTENVPAILGFGVAAVEASKWLKPENIKHMEQLREKFETMITQEHKDAHINSSGAPRAWTTCSISFPSIKSELMLLMLSERGVCASSGSACSSGAFKESKVIEAIGTPGDGEWGTVRFSLARTTTLAELEQAAEALSDVLSTIDEIITESVAT